MTHSMPIATRRSPLALAQSHTVSETLAEMSGQASTIDMFPLMPLVSTGDRRNVGALSEIGGKGLFTKEIEAALLNADARFAVHSMKDMPPVMPPGLTLGAIPAREDPRDAFICIQADTPWALPQGARFGTASIRREAQIRRRRADLHFEVIRGNVERRLRLVQDGMIDATCLAMAGLNRLGIADAIIHPLDISESLPAIGQGALCVQVRSDDREALEYAHAINCRKTASCVILERAFLSELDGSCRTPIAGIAEWHNGEVHFRGCVLSHDGTDYFDIEKSVSIPEQMGFGALDMDIENTLIASGREAGQSLKAKAGNDVFKQIQR